MANKLITITDEEKEQLKKANAKYKSGLTLEPVGGVRALARIPEPDVNNNIGDAIAYGAESGWEGVKSGLNSAQLGARYLAADKIGMDNTADKLENELRLAEQNALKNQQEIASKYNTNFGGVADKVQGVINAAVGMGPALALGLLTTAVTKNPVVGVNTARVIRGVPLAETMVQAGGNAINQAIGDGATTDEALKFGGAKAVAEGIPEYLFKGIKYMPGTIDIGEKLAGKVANETVKKATRFAGNMAGEGIEEGIVEIADPFLKNATYSEGEKIDWDAVRESAILGALTGGVMNAGITGIEKGVNALPNVQKVQQKDQNRAFEALHGQKMEKKNADASQNAENALGQEIVDTAIKNTLNGNKASQNQSSQADFVKNTIENVMNQKPVQNAPKMDPTISEMETVGAKNAQAGYETKPTDEKSSTVYGNDFDVNELSEEERVFFSELNQRFGGSAKLSKNLPDDVNGMLHNGEVILNANKLSEPDTIRFATVHEFGHKMKGTAEYDSIQEMALKYFRSIADDPEITDMDLVEYIKGTRQGTDYEIQSEVEAYDELTTMFMEMAFDDVTTIDKICVEQPSLAQRILEFIEQKIHDYNAKKGLSKLEKQQYDMLAKTRRLYVQGLRKTNQKDAKKKSGGLFTNDAVQSDSKEMRYSINSVRHDIDEGKMRSDLINHGLMTEQEADAFIANLSDLADHIESFQSAFLDMFEPYGKEGRATLPYKDNSDPLYKVSLDFSTLCKKRIITQAMIERLQVAKGRALSAEEQIAIRDYLKELKQENDKIEVACAMCYVEAARLRTPKYINEFIDNPVKIVQKYLGTKNEENKAAIEAAGNAKLKELGYAEGTKLKAVKTNSIEDWKAVKGARDAVKDSYKATSPEEIAILDFLENEFEPRMVLTASGMMELKQKQPVVYTALNAFLAGKSKAKALQTGEPYYYGDASAVGDELIAQMNAENGIRHNSWSDFEITHLLDLLVAVTELSVRKAKMHYYSKVPAEFYVMKDTGAIGNISLIPKGQTGFDSNGNLDFDPVEGVPYEEAMKIRDDCSRSAGTTAIGISDAHIKALLESDVIDYVIPYHTSGLNKTLRSMVGINGWTDYQNYQNEKNSKGKNAENALNFSDWFHPTQKDIETKTGIQIMREAQAEYLRLCKERGITPKFSNTKDGTDFSKHENYWKLLIDRKMIDNEGNIIIQQEVKPNFDFDYMKKLVNEEYKKSPESSIEEGIRAVENLGDEDLNARVELLKSQKNADTRLSVSIDKDYLDAVKRGDMETAQRMVNEQAEKAGYTDDNSWRMSHSAPNSKDGFSVSLKDLKNSDMVPRDYWDRPDWYTNSPEEREAFRKVKKAIELQEKYDSEGKGKDAVIWIYRAVDKTKNSREGSSRNGDWVTPVRAYAENEGRMNPNGYRIIEHAAKLKDLYWNGDSIAELGYDDGQNYSYADTKNNRKLLDAVTYDDDGNVIPLSKRFKKRNEDARYSTGSSRYQQRVNEIKNIKHKREVSKVYSNTIKESNLFTEAEMNIELNASEYEYDVKSEKESLHRATERLENDHAGTSKELMHKKMYTGEDLDAAMFLLRESIESGRETGNYNHAKAWLKKIQEAGTESGRMIQAYAKYSRTTAEGIAVQAERYVQQAEDSLKAGHAKGKIAGKEIGKDKDSRKWQKVEGEVKKAQKAVEDAEVMASKSAQKELEMRVKAYKAKHYKTNPNPKAKPETDFADKLYKKVIEGTNLELEEKGAITGKRIVDELYQKLKENGMPDYRGQREKRNYTSLEYLKDAVQRKAEYAEVFEKTQEYMKAEYGNDPEVLQLIKGAMNGNFSNLKLDSVYSKKTVEKAVKETAELFDIDFKEIIKQSKGDKDEAAQVIVNHIMQFTDVPDADAKKLADDVVNAYCNELKRMTDQRLKQLFPELVQPQLKKASKKKTTWFEDVMELINLGAYDNQDIVDIIKQKNDLPVLTSADIETIYSEVEKANQYKKYSYEWKIHMAKAQQVAADKMPQSMKNKVTQLKRIMMLSNPRTDVRNLAGNMPLTGTEMMSNAIASIADKKLSEKRGTQRTISAKPELGAFAQGFAKGFGETVSDIKQGVNTYRMGEESTTQYEMPRGRTFDNAFLNGIDKAVNYGLMFGDRPFFEGHYNKRMAELERLGYDITSDEAKADAYGHAVDMVFQSDSDMAKGASGIREALNSFLTIGDAFALGDFVIPFVQTPANIADKLIDYSPLGLARAAWQVGKSNTEVFDQKLFCQRLGRSLTGMSILVVSYELAKAGILTGSSDDDPEKRRAMEASGWKPYSIKIGNTYYDYSFIQPVGMIMAIGADMYKERRSVDDLTDLVVASGAGIKGGVNCFFNMSFFSSLIDFFGGYGDTASNMGKAVLDFPTQFAPAVVNAANKSIDPYQRETYDDDPIKRTINKFVAKTPASQTLPKKLDVYGNEMMHNQGRNAVQRTIENMLFPSTVSQKTPNALNDELLRLNKSTGSKSQFLSYPDNKLDLGSAGEYRLSGEERNTFIKNANGYASEQMSKLIQTKEYKVMSDAKKVKVLNDIEKYAKYLAEQKLAESHGKKFVDEDYEKIKKSRIEPYKYYVMTDFMSNITGDGQKAKRISYLERQKKAGVITDEQYWYMRMTKAGTPSKADIKDCPYAWIKAMYH